MFKKEFYVRFERTLKDIKWCMRSYKISKEMDFTSNKWKSANLGTDWNYIAIAILHRGGAFEVKSRCFLLILKWPLLGFDLLYWFCQFFMKDWLLTLQIKLKVLPRAWHVTLQYQHKEKIIEDISVQNVVVWVSWSIVCSQTSCAVLSHCFTGHPPPPPPSLQCWIILTKAWTCQHGQSTL